mgnify:CR=1 FL=1
MANAKLQFKVLTLSEAAANRVRDILANSERPVSALKIGVKNGGCAGMSYTMDWVDHIGPYDEVIEDQGVRLVIDPKAIMFLIGTQMDFRTDKMSSGFIFNNPTRPRLAAVARVLRLSLPNLRMSNLRLILRHEADEKACSSGLFRSKAVGDKIQDHTPESLIPRIKTQHS